MFDVSDMQHYLSAYWVSSASTSRRIALRGDALHRQVEISEEHTVGASRRATSRVDTLEHDACIGQGETRSNRTRWRTLPGMTSTDLTAFNHEMRILTTGGKEPPIFLTGDAGRCKYDNRVSGQTESHNR